MPFLRPPEYFLNRFHTKQEQGWLAYKAGLDLVLAHGRRSGKSELIAEIFIEDIEDNGKDCMYIALTQGQAREIMWPKFVARLSDLKDWKSNEARLEWKHIPTKATISLKGADLGKDRLRGSAKRLIAVDECAFIKDPTIVKDVLVPQLADYNGQFIYCSTPKGKNHFYDLKQLAEANPNKFFTNHCTVFENPYVSPEGRNKLLAEYAGENDPLYRQEILAEFVDFHGLIFAIPQEDYVVNTWDHADLEFSFHWIGMDHGFSPDPTACVWMAFNKKKNYYLIYQEYKQAQLLIHQHADIIKNKVPYKFIEIISDIDPQVIAEYENIGLRPISKAYKQDKEASILRLLNALKTGQLKITPNCKELLKEMQRLEWNKDGEDHLSDAMRYVFNNAYIPSIEAKKRPESLRPPIDFTNLGQGSYEQVFDDYED